MDTTILQVPLTKSLKVEATGVAKENGFSSLQEVVRLMLTKFARREIGVTIEQFPAVKLSSGNEKRYNKIREDFEKGRNIKTFNNVNDLMNDLTS